VLNWPNVLTAARIVAAPFVIVFLFGPTRLDHAVALAIFLAAVLTDLLDGWLARRLRCVTDFGKFLDPLADKVIVISALVSFVWLRLVPLWMVLAIVARDLIIMGFRGVAAVRGIYIYASTLAKWKTGLQMAAVVAILVKLVLPSWVGEAWPAWLDAGLDGTLWLVVILTLATGVWYLWKNRQVVASIFVR
jgi:CDP-diacylglycerol--glycerol-3-phosphate 3-phosphatidyltransferase